MIDQPKIRWRVTLESQFQEKLKKLLEGMGYWAYKLPDNNHTPKPYDMITVSPSGDTYHCELKIIECDTFNKDDLRPNQKKALSEVSKRNPESAIVLVYSKKHADYVVIRYIDLERRQKIFANVKNTV